MTNREMALALSSMNRYEFSVEESNAAYNAALAMSEWKDEQVKAEKEALINKACEWLRENASKHIHGQYSFLKGLMLEEFQQAMKGGEE